MESLEVVRKSVSRALSSRSFRSLATTFLVGAACVIALFHVAYSEGDTSFESSTCLLSTRRERRRISTRVSVVSLSSTGSGYILTLNVVTQATRRRLIS